MSRVLLLFGGRSAEHEVSCASAVSVHDALTSAGHHVIPVGIDRDGAWFLADTATRPFRAEGRSVEFVVPGGHLRVGDDQLDVDVVFPVLHGPMGEDGTVQGLLEVCDLPYVGCGVLGSATSMDKGVAKQLVSSMGIATSPWRTVRRGEWETSPSDVIADVEGSLAYPLFVKPIALGSSVGITRVGQPGELPGAITLALRYGDAAIVEQAVTGREIEVAVLDGPASSEPGEVIVASGWYTYDAKYADESSRFEAPANLPKSAATDVRRLAEQVFTALGLNGLARIDFFYDRDTRRFLFNEANTMPGFTSISGFPKMWIATGMTYPELCDRLVGAAFERHAARTGIVTR
jgi:D-alanine-D-alanine ligase